ncbi:Flp family type IVb pilin [Qipengyuania sp. 6B39]|uniref:Flp family type IVb pilin n=1 Tax=Qipengyuania proteolytica TaxID=2867239 RepID=UPI001C89C8C8|nr:Flp family type IVb pilin [Qipengyuania proteolytica]MBX7496295.1 Flp family type IVb pilin [Qipengyuania proteolytica]
MTFLHALGRDERGATAIEYGLIVALIAVAAIVSLQALGNELSTTMNKVGTTMSAGNAAA